MQFQKENFNDDVRNNFLYQLLTNKIYKFLLVRNGNENDYFDIGAFFRNHNISKKQANFYIVRVLEDIRAGGWNCGTSFYKTGLFIYSDKKPPNFYPDTDEF